LWDNPGDRLSPTLDLLVATTAGGGVVVVVVVDVNDGWEEGWTRLLLIEMLPFREIRTVDPGAGLSRVYSMTHYPIKFKWF
jgi:hypothetical protein